LIWGEEEYEMVGSKTCQELVNEVFKKDLCTLCGACVGLCPYFIAYNGRILLRDICDLSQGRCSTFCPRISLDLEKLSKTIFGIPYSWDGIGAMKAIFMARSTNAKVKARAQDAGTVTTLFYFAKDEGFIDSAVLTLFEDKLFPKGVVVSTKDEILACAGSSYIATPTVEAFNRSVQDGNRKRIGFVGTPCQVLSLTKMKESKLEEKNPTDQLELIIGLFCTWALSHPNFNQFLEREVSDHIVKYDIPPHPANVLKVYTEKNHIDISLEKIIPFVRPACWVCHDLTAEFADISVGSGRGEVSEWNTVIVRTSRGMEIVEGAEKKGMIEIREMPKENLSRLEGAAMNKKKRALKNILEKTGSVDDLLFFKVQTERIKPLLGE
jgi:coenzyme F420 hydrogenase subunit beta